MKNNYEIKLSFLQTIDNYHIFILHLTSHLIQDGIREKFCCDSKKLDTGHRQLIGAFAIPTKDKRKTDILNITKIGETNLKKIYGILNKIKNIVDIEGNDTEVYAEIKNQFYLRPIEEFDYII